MLSTLLSNTRSDFDCDFARFFRIRCRIGVRGNVMKCCVYTVVIGDYENLNEQPVASRSQLPFICLTDDASLQSSSWDCRLVTPLFPEDPIRSQRDLKIRPHLYLREYDCSVYIDNSVILKEPPERLLELLDPKTGFLIPHHSYRESVLDEFLEVARLGFDEPTRIFEQLNHYTLSCPEILDQRPWWSAILVRDHRSARVCSMLEIWASHVMRYSRRDQLSINLAFHAASLSPTALTVDNFGSDLHMWPVTPGRDRQRGPRNPNISLMPIAARVRHLEQQQVEMVGAHQGEIAQHGADRDFMQSEIARLSADRDFMQSEIARLNAKAEARKPKNRLRRLGRKILRLPRRIAHATTFRAEEAPAPAPAVETTPEPQSALDRVRTANGAWIYVDPSDGRGRSLIEAAGNFNPHTLSTWHRLLSEQDWTHVIDVGANYGEMLVNGSIPAEAKLIAIEPNPTIRPYLERTLSEAGIAADIMDVALSDQNGEAALLVDTDWSGTTRLAPADDASAIPVQTSTLDAILRSLDAAPSSMRIVLKVDVEGSEAAVLKGGLSTLSSLGDFAALVEIMHVPPSDIAWMSEQFEIALLETDPNGGLVTVPPQELHDMLSSGRYFTQDAVLRRHPARAC